MSQPQTRSTLLKRTDYVLEELRELEESYQRGRILKEGVFTVLAGTTNTGKSLIFNTLSEEDRAIVTSHAGTTRGRNSLRSWTWKEYLFFSMTLLESGEKPVRLKAWV